MINKTIENILLNNFSNLSCFDLNINQLNKTEQEYIVSLFIQFCLKFDGFLCCYTFDKKMMSQFIMSLPLSQQKRIIEQIINNKKYLILFLFEEIDMTNLISLELFKKFVELYHPDLIIKALSHKNLFPKPEFEFFFKQHYNKIAKSKINGYLFSYESTYKQFFHDISTSCKKYFLYSDSVRSNSKIYFEDLNNHQIDCEGYYNFKEIPFKNIMSYYNQIKSITDKEELLLNPSFTPDELTTIYKKTKSKYLKKSITENINCPPNIKLLEETN